MLKINRTSRFKKEYKLMMKRGNDAKLFEFIVGEIANGRPLEPKYNDHALKGSFEGFRECHIQPDWLLIYIVEDDVLTLTLTRTGTHADIFK